MAFAGRTITVKGTPAQVLTALQAQATANTVVGCSLTILSATIWIVVAGIDNTAAGGQTVEVAPGGTLAATNIILNAAATLATTSIDVLEVYGLGDAWTGGIIVYK